MLLAASTQRTIGFVILAIVFAGGLLYLFFNIRSAKAEVGSEIELAPNRSPALLDEDLEGRRLDLALLANLVMLTIIAIALPFYWLGEPGRSEGRNADTARIFQNRGEEIYVEGAQCVNCHGAAGAGGAVTTSLLDDEGGFIAQVVWNAPALNTVLSRFSEDEVLYTLNFGRNGVMPAWGAGGGGPLTDQQLQEVMFYLRSIQLDPPTIARQVESGVSQRVEEMIIAEWDDDFAVAIRDAQAVQLEATLAVEAVDLKCSDPADAGDSLCVDLKAATDALLAAQDDGRDELELAAAEWIADAQAVAETARRMAIEETPALADEARSTDLRFAALDLLSTPGAVANQETYLRYGEFLFTNPAVGGTYSCARCHTYGFSFNGADRFSIRSNGTTESVNPEGYSQAGGFFGPNLTGGSTLDQFGTARSHALFIETGQTIGRPYGRGGDGGNGQMPGFGPRTETDTVGPGIASDLETDYPALLTSAQIDAIVAFERNL
jgi:mono/diheme cytochrome c family protein